MRSPVGKASTPPTNEISIDAMLSKPANILSEFRKGVAVERLRAEHILLTVERLRHQIKSADMLIPHPEEK